MMGGGRFPVLSWFSPVFDQQCPNQFKFVTDAVFHPTPGSASELDCEIRISSMLKQEPDNVSIPRVRTAGAELSGPAKRITSVRVVPLFQQKAYERHPVRMPRPY